MKTRTQAQPRTRRLNFHLRLCGLALLPLLAAACSGDDPQTSEEPPGGSVTEDPDPTSTAPDCEQNPLIEGCPGSTPEVEGEGEGEGATGGETQTENEGSSEQELLQAGVEDQLEKYCGDCHGAAARENGTVQGRMDYIDSFDRMTEEGQIIRGDSRNSYAIQRLIDGSMPPASYEGPRPTDAEIDQIVAFVDNPNFDPAPARDCDDQLMTFDEVFDHIQRDIFRQDDEDRAFTRYLTLTNRYNAGVCAQEGLDVERFSMSKLVNMLSNQTQIRAPFAVDPEETIYRIDIRDYGWDREVEVNGQVFEDGWEALAANSPYAVIFEGTEAETVRDQIESDFALLYSDAFVDAASIGNLYYALTDIDANQSLDDFIALDLGIDIQDNFDQENVIRAGTTESRISNQDRVTERHEIEERQGAFWQSFDFVANEVNDNIFNDPFDFAAGGTEAIFSLPNGLFGFIIADADGNLVEESDILLDRTQNDFKARTAVSCSGCHASGLLPVSDQVREVVLSNPINFDADEIELVRDIYLPEAEFAAFIEDDSARFRDALARANVPRNINDPVQTTFVRFDDDMKLADAAGDLGVSRQLLLTNLARLDPQLSILSVGSIDRDDFTALFLASLCQMQVSSQNRPEQAQCDAALAALE